jgi:hypothetical protein
MSLDLLTEAILDEYRDLKVCHEHWRSVWYDEPECPCCRMEYEFLAGEFGHGALPRAAR